MIAPTDRRTFLRGFAKLPLLGGSLAIVGAPSAPVSLVQAATLSGIDDPRERARIAWDGFVSAMGDVAAGADGWCIIGAADRWTPLPGPHPQTGSFLRVASVHYVDERRPGASRPFFVERHREIALDPLEEARLREREARGEVRL